MSEHQHGTESNAQTTHDEVAKRAYDIYVKEGRPPGHDLQNWAQAEGKKPNGKPDHHAHMAADFRKRFWISLALTVPILALSPMLQAVVGLREAIRFPGDLYGLFGLSSAVFWYGGWPFLKGFFQEIESRRPGMMMLISVAIATAYVYSSAVVFGLAGKMFFWELGSLIDIMLLGHWIEMKSVMGASRALEELAKLMPSDAHKVMPDGSVKDVPLGELSAADSDGQNDAPALALGYDSQVRAAQADLGIAIGAGSDVAVETADVILVRSNPLDVVAILKLSRATYRKMVQNLLWATGYNVVAIPLAAGALYAWGVLLTPAVGPMLMSASTVIVAVNARRLKIENPAHKGNEPRIAEPSQPTPQIPTIATAG